MTAIEILQAMNNEIQDPLYWTKEEQNEAIDKAAKALDKQRKRPIREDGEFGCCPNCNREFNSELLNEYDLAYCLSCGQRLDR